MSKRKGRREPADLELMRAENEQERQYELASSDVVIGLSREEADALLTLLEPSEIGNESENKVASSVDAKIRDAMNRPASLLGAGCPVPGCGAGIEATVKHYLTVEGDAVSELPDLDFTFYCANDHPLDGEDRVAWVRAEVERRYLSGEVDD